jgi:hypothetical protein
MWTFLLILLLVFAAVDLLVKFVIDPLASKKWKMKKAAEPKEKIVEPSIGLVGATMYDGGKSKETEKSNNETDTGQAKDGNLPVK